MKKNICLMLFAFLSLFVSNGHALTDEDYQLVKTFHDRFKYPLDFSQTFHALSPDKQQMVLTEKLKDEDSGSILLTRIMTNYFQNGVTKESANIVTPEAIEASLRSITSITDCDAKALEVFLNKLNAEVKNDLILKSDGAGKNWWEQVCDTMSDNIKEIQYPAEKIYSFEAKKTDQYFELQILFLNHLSGDVDKDHLILGDKAAHGDNLPVHNPLVYATLFYRDDEKRENENEIKQHQKSIIHAITTLMTSLSCNKIRVEALESNIATNSPLEAIVNPISNNPLLFHAIQKRENEFVAAMVNSITNKKLRDQLILKKLADEELSSNIIQDSGNTKVFDRVTYNYSALSFAILKQSDTFKYLLNLLSEDDRKKACTKSDIIDFCDETSKKTSSLIQPTALFYIGSKLYIEEMNLKNGLDIMLSYNLVEKENFQHNALLENLTTAIHHNKGNFCDNNNNNKGKGCQYCKWIEKRGSKDFYMQKTDDFLHNEIISTILFIIVFLKHMEPEERNQWIEEKKILDIIKQDFPYFLTQENYTVGLSEVLSNDVRNKYFRTIFEEQWPIFLKKHLLIPYVPSMAALWAIDEDLRRELIVKHQVLSHIIITGHFIDDFKKILRLFSQSQRDEVITAVGDKGRNLLHWAALHIQNAHSIDPDKKIFFNLLVENVSDGTLLKKALEQKDDSGQTPLEIYPKAQELFSKKFGLEGKMTHLKESLEVLREKLQSLMGGLGKLTEKLKAEAS